MLEILDIAPVWAVHPVLFALLTHGDKQYVAYYDTQRQLTVAARSLNERQWKYQKLPITTGWDSHNYVALAADKTGNLHLSGDMHVAQLNYFRTTKPGNIASFQRQPGMVGNQENRVTYPHFLKGSQGELIFKYRDGMSGDGSEIYNVYNEGTQSWRRLLDQPLTDGGGKRNAYFNGPIAGPDGYFHVTWVWRETPDAETCHDLSYARSRDLVHWERSDGTPQKLPITLETSEIVDPVPMKGGMINNNALIGFDDQGRVTITYHKFDAQGFTQPMIARLQEGKWKIHQIADWPYRWEFGGRGSLKGEISLSGLKTTPEGLRQNYNHAKFGRGYWLLDPQILRATWQGEPNGPEEAFSKPESTFPGMTVRWRADTGASPLPDRRYMLRWETLPPNRDRPRPEPWPEPTMLRLYAMPTAPAPRATAGVTIAAQGATAPGP